MSFREKSPREKCPREKGLLGRNVRIPYILNELRYSCLYLRFYIYEISFQFRNAFTHDDEKHHSTFHSDRVLINQAFDENT